MKFEHDELSRRHPCFRYRNFSYQIEKEELKVTYDFLLDPGTHFAPTLSLPIYSSAAFAKLPREELQRLIFHIGMAEMLSYWKCAAPAEIVVSAGELTSEQICWWQSFFRDGLSEFFYVNDIKPFSPRISAASPTTVNPLVFPEPAAAKNSPILLPIGGGKDSIVSLQLLREGNYPVVPFLLNKITSAHNVIEAAGFKRYYLARRVIDPKLLELNSSGYLNGHTPFSAVLAFISVAAARLSGCHNIALSNERSADEPNTTAHALSVNHQYSKGTDFEKLFRDYCQTYLTRNADYFSLLRPLYELQIAALFAKYTDFFPHFRSCNRGLKSNTWCKKCPKCLFAFTILAPFVPRDNLCQAFGGNLFEDLELLPIARQLTGLEPVKPLECVGTRDETIAAMFLARRNFQQPDGSLPPVLAEIVNSRTLEQATLTKLGFKLLADWNSEHSIPDYLCQVVKNAQLRILPSIECND